MKSKQIITVVAAVVSVGFSALCAWYFTGFSKMYSGTPEKITIGKMPIESHALIYIAAIQGLLGNDWIASHPETIKRFLRSLDQAEEYTAEHSVEAKAIIQKRLNYGDEARWTVNIIR